jgi:hypothetical protein
VLPVKKRPEALVSRSSPPLPSLKAEPKDATDEDTDPELLKAIELSKLTISEVDSRTEEGGRDAAPRVSKFKPAVDSGPSPASPRTMSDEPKRSQSSHSSASLSNEKKRKRDDEGSASVDSESDTAATTHKERAKPTKKPPRPAEDDDDAMDIERKPERRDSGKKDEKINKRENLSDDKFKSSSSSSSSSATAARPSSSSGEKKQREQQLQQSRTDSRSPSPKRSKKRSPSPETRTKKHYSSGDRFRLSREEAEAAELDAAFAAANDRMSDDEGEGREADEREKTKKKSKGKSVRFDERRHKRLDEVPRDEEEAFHMRHAESISSDSDDDRHGAEREDAEYLARARARGKVMDHPLKPSRLALDKGHGGQRHWEWRSKYEEEAEEERANERGRKHRHDDASASMRKSLAALREKLAREKEGRGKSSSSSSRGGTIYDDQDDDDEDEYGADDCDVSEEEDEEDDSDEEVSDLINDSVPDIDVPRRRLNGGGSSAQSKVITPELVKVALNTTTLYYPVGLIGDDTYLIRYSRLSDAVRTLINLKRSRVFNGLQQQLLTTTAAADTKAKTEEMDAEWESIVKKDMAKFFTKYFDFLPVPVAPEVGSATKTPTPVEMSSWSVPMRQIISFVVALITLPKIGEATSTCVDISTTELGKSSGPASAFIAPYHAELLISYVMSHVGTLIEDDREALYSIKNVWMRWETKTTEELIDAMISTTYVSELLRLLSTVKTRVQ